MVGGIRSTQYDSRMTRAELRSPNSWLLRAARRSSQEIFCLDTAFALIDGTDIFGWVICVFVIRPGAPPSKMPSR